MKLVLSGLFVMVVTRYTVNSYDFHDSLFNNLLSSYWNEIDDTLEIAQKDHGRSRRDEEAVKEKCHPEHHHQGPKLCCGEDFLRSLKESVQDISKKCYKDVTGHEFSAKGTKYFDLFSCEAVEKRKSDMICIEQCKGQQLGLLNEDGTPIKENLTTYFKEYSANSLISENMVEKCMAKANSFSEYPMKFHTEGLKKCNPFAMFFMHCLFQQIQFNCPEDQIKDKESCQKLRAEILKS
ncbi:uncharacterized protein [Euwallacea similis]|uniref:uncharacterized protein isoform X2 n=1 Tax=Euwallacea similis TaxID=1736056 RepID=UPI00344F178E